MTEEELITYIEIGRCPILVYCEKMYEGICRMIRITKNHTVFLDYSNMADDAASEGEFRVTFQYDAFPEMVHAIEQFIGSPLSDWQANCWNPEDFACEEPEYLQLQWDVYHHKIPFLLGTKERYIGDLFWYGLYTQEIMPDCSIEELTA